MSGLIPRPSPLGFDMRDADARSNGLETTRERRPGVSVDRRQRTASWITTTFFISPRGFGFGCRDCTRREDYDMDCDTVRDAAADESAAQRWRMEVSTTGAAQR